MIKGRHHCAEGCTHCPGWIFSAKAAEDIDLHNVSCVLEEIRVDIKACACCVHYDNLVVLSTHKVVHGLCQRGHSPHAHLVISVPREQGGSICGPRQACAVGGLCLARALLPLRAQLSHHSLGLEVPDGDVLAGGSAQPVPVGAEAQGVDHTARLQGVQLLQGG